MRYVMMTLILFLSLHVSAHEWTPTYPKWEMSFIPDVLKAEMKLFNNRSDVRYYEITVHDEDWNVLRSMLRDGSSIVNVDYKETKYIDVFINRSDRDRAVYICSLSKILAENSTKTFMYSRICSKVK